VKTVNCKDIDGVVMLTAITAQPFDCWCGSEKVKHKNKNLHFIV
jgi:hypothetical protein